MARLWPHRSPADMAAPPAVRRGWLDRREGRKYFVRGELRHGEVVCAEAEGPFVALKPEQR